MIQLVIGGVRPKIKILASSPVWTARLPCLFCSAPDFLL